MKRFLLLFILHCFATFFAFGQSPYWEAAVGPYGGGGAITVCTNNIIYDQDQDGFYLRSTDYGVHWSPFEITSADPAAYSEDVTIGFSGKFYSNILKQEGSTWLRRLYCSSDEGASWELRNEDLFLLKTWETPSGVLLGHNTSSNIYRSLDGGFTWQATGNYDFIGIGSAVSIHYGADGRIALLNQTGVTYSLNHGASWQSGGNWNITLDNNYELTPTGTLFRLHGQLAFSDTLLYRSTDWGLHWQSAQIDFEEEEYPASILQLTIGKLLLATNKHIYVSNNDGVSWTVLSTGPEKAQYFLTKVPLPNGDLIGIYKDAIFRSADEGANWSLSATGMKMATTQQLALLTDSLQMAVTENGLWRTDDAGNSWTRLLVDTSARDYAFNNLLGVKNADTFAVWMGLRLWRTFDAGAHFTEITPANPTSSGFLFITPNGRTFTNNSAGIVVSADFGDSWQSTFTGSKVIHLVQHPNGTLFMVAAPMNDTNDKHLYRSSDNGANWEEIPVTEFASYQGFYELAMGPEGELYASGYDHYLKIARSDDLGETWTYESLPDAYAIGPLAINALGHLFTNAGAEVKMFSSVDQAMTWYQLPSYAESVSILYGLEMSPSGYLYIVPSGGLVYRTAQNTQTGGYIRGRVLRDADADCSTPDAQAGPMRHWPVKITGTETFYASTSESGQYSFFGPAGTYDVEAQVPQNLWWTLCDSLLSTQIDSGQITDHADFVAIAASECPLMSVDVAIPNLRRCFNNTIYVAYCNIGSEPADSAWVDVELDPYLNFIESEQPYQSLGNNSYRFQLGDVAWGDCGQFAITVYVNCDSTVLGQTHCVSSHAFPDTLCTPVPNWSGATIEANATCQDSVVHLQLRNSGTSPSGTLNYIIIEDDVVLLHNQRQYNIGDVFNMDYPANGHTWRVESEQEPGHPFSNVALAFLEGCGGHQTLGYINQFSVNGWTPSVNKACLENGGSYDPNDKQGFPTGYGDNHRIRPGQALEYMIRFQNTGTDTAFTVQIRDTLSAWLDAGTIRPGASSHPYTWNLSGPGVLTFRFDHIMLPDSNVNLAGSQGFVSFWIDQKPEVPLETQILNTAAIYFDFNAPVMTNQTLHTVGLDYITAIKDFEKQEVPAIVVQPNPAVQETLVSLPSGTERLMVFDVLGRSMRVLQVRGATVRLERGNLPAGVYWLQLQDRKGATTGAGKLIWK